MGIHSDFSSDKWGFIVMTTCFDSYFHIFPFKRLEPRSYSYQIIVIPEKHHLSGQFSFSLSFQVEFWISKKESIVLPASPIWWFASWFPVQISPWSNPLIKYFRFWRVTIKTHSNIHQLVKYQKPIQLSIVKNRKTPSFRSILYYGVVCFFQT